MFTQKKIFAWTCLLLLSGLFVVVRGYQSSSLSPTKMAKQIAERVNAKIKDALSTQTELRALKDIKKMMGTATGYCVSDHDEGKLDTGVADNVERLKDYLKTFLSSHEFQLQLGQKASDNQQKSDFDRAQEMYQEIVEEIEDYQRIDTYDQIKDGPEQGKNSKYSMLLAKYAEAESCVKGHQLQLADWYANKAETLSKNLSKLQKVYEKRIEHAPISETLQAYKLLEQHQMQVRECQEKSLVLRQEAAALSEQEKRTIAAHRDYHVYRRMVTQELSARRAKASSKYVKQPGWLS